VLIDTFMRHSMEYARSRLTHIIADVITFRKLVCMQQNFPLMFFIPRHINPEYFIQIDQKL